MPATRTLSNGHRVEELLYLDVHGLLLSLLKEHKMRTDDINYDWPYTPMIKELCIQCIDSSNLMDEKSIAIFSDACICDPNGHIPESIRNIILSFTRIEKTKWNKKNRVIISIPPLNHRGPADPASWELEVDLGDAPQF